MFTPTKNTTIVKRLSDEHGEVVEFKTNKYNSTVTLLDGTPLFDDKDVNRVCDWLYMCGYTIHVQ